MRAPLILLLAALLLFPGRSSASADGLALAGSGEIRYLGFIKVYSAELYVDRQVLESPEIPTDFSKCLVLHYDVSISGEDIRRGADAVLARQHSPARLEDVRQFIDLLHASYQDVADGDSYALCYDARTGETELAFNGVEVVSLRSREFAELYFGIWLGRNEPIDETLRDDLLAFMPRG